MATDYHGYPQGVPAPVGDGGVDLLRKLRGDERVSFNDVADHMIDYAKLHPGALRAIDAFARYVAEIEGVDHDHDSVSKGSVEADGDPPEA
jgi:hypothetical protein